MSERDLRLAAKAVRDLAKEQGGIVSARDAHEAWRWVLVSRGWKQGEHDVAAKTHPSLVAFDVLGEAVQVPALLGLEEADAEQDDSDGELERIEVSG